MAVDAHSSGPSSQEEARRLFDDYDHDPFDGNSAIENQKSTKSDKVTPLPRAQLATLCIVRLVDPIAFTQIFPYVNEMMERLHLTDDPSRIGFYSGLVVSDIWLVDHATMLTSVKSIGKQFRHCPSHFHIPVGQIVGCVYSTILICPWQVLN